AAAPQHLSEPCSAIPVRTIWGDGCTLATARPRVLGSQGGADTSWLAANCQEIANGKRIHAALQVARDRVGGTSHDRLAAVVTGVQENGNADQPPKLLDQTIVAGVVHAIYGLYASRAVDVDGRRDELDLVG